MTCYISKATHVPPAWLTDFFCVFLCVRETPAGEVKRENARGQWRKRSGRGWGGQRTTAGYSLMFFFFVLGSAFARLNVFKFKNQERKNTQKPASYAGKSIKSFFWVQNSTNRGALGSTYSALHISLFHPPPPPILHNPCFSFLLTWDQAQFSFRFVNNILAGKAVAVRENVWEPRALKLGRSQVTFLLDITAVPSCQCLCLQRLKRNVNRLRFFGA